MNLEYNYDLEFTNGRPTDEIEQASYFSTLYILNLYNPYAMSETIDVKLA